MRFREFILGSATKIVVAARRGNYIVQNIDLEQDLTEDEAIEAAAGYILNNNKTPQIKNLKNGRYRIF